MEHSKNYEKIKYYYDSGLWSYDRVWAVVGKKNGITEEEAREITESNDFPYSKADIKAMKVAELREVAAEYGIDNPEEYTSTELKNLLIEKFNL